MRRLTSQPDRTSVTGPAAWFIRAAAWLVYRRASRKLPAATLPSGSSSSESTLDAYGDREPGGLGYGESNSMMRSDAVVSAKTAGPGVIMAASRLPIDRQRLGNAPARCRVPGEAGARVHSVPARAQLQLTRK
jgi:hypothetical protein